ncbi:hypothetical protein BU23DRAFT_627726 [Bimuria novae-zelandiae CBS 107.79]|uniref:Apple domain-containing protein n=1 Tax=Bimuria novae-zelandiae CBS 107.79 TaxID=1447943 RepID=A0A6A5UKR0_9PLEO|nr:hypothetical protein BU23DRAFT_627726 [Bimuria novae-zelandiae CBS 107.79]
MIDGNTLNVTGSVFAPEDYITYHYLNTTYDVDACADKCDTEPGCASFNIYFTREPSRRIIQGLCEIPPTITNIVCGLYRSKINMNSTTNDRQLVSPAPTAFERDQIGSNGYNKNTTVLPTSRLRYYSKEKLGNLVIAANDPYTGAPLNSYMFVTQIPATIPERKVEVVNGVPAANVKCALFAETVGPQHATNKGYVPGNTTVTIRNSSTYVCENC